MAAASKGTGTKRSTGTSSSRTRSGSTAKRTGSGTRSSSGRKSGSLSRNTKNKRDTASYELQNEVVLMITLVVSVLLFLSNFNLGGAVGSAVNGGMFGLFGIVAYLFPILLFFGMAFYLANRGSRTLTAKMIYAFGMLLMLTAFIQLLTTYRPAQLAEANIEEGAKLSLGNYYTLARDFKKGGGIFGGFVTFCFEPLFGKVGS